MSKINEFTFLECNKPYDISNIVIFGAPFDGTTSYRPGTRFAPNAIRNESFGIESYSFYQDRDIIDMNVCDIGDIDIPIGNTIESLKAIEDTTKQILDDCKIPFMIGGEHLVTLGAFRAIHDKYKEVHVIHFDAHADLRQEYLNQQLSHACVLRRIHDIIGDNKIYQFGIRSGISEEYKFGKEHNNFNPFDLKNVDSISELKDKPVYITIDLDVLDPSIFAGTGTPEPGGVTFNELLNAFKAFKGLNIVGIDVNELSPMYDTSNVSTIVACKVIRELLLVLGGK